jgi:hypothetical protein
VARGWAISDDQSGPFQIIKIKWFASLWRKLGFKSGAHLRRVHYALVSQNPPVTKPNGKTYLNTEGDWDYLTSVSKWARYLGLVSPNAFVDRRNPEALLNARLSQRSNSSPGFQVEGGWSEWDSNLLLPSLPDLPQELPPLPDFCVGRYQGIEQSYLIEVWVEKTSMNDVLIPLCRRYRANLVTSAGELSITAVMDFLKRVRNAHRPARIFYISDFDPAGLGMPISVARKIEFAQRDRSDGDFDIRLQPIALTAQQVKKHRLPRVPVKDTDRRKSHFEAAYGEGAVELDALEALHPGRLARIVEEAILKYYDPTLGERALKAQEEMQAALAQERQAVLAEWQGDLNTLRDDYQALLDDFARTQADFAELVQSFQPRIDAHQERWREIQEHGRAVYARLCERLKQVEVNLDNYPLPAPDLPKEAKNMLYDSSREYLKQLAAYKARRNGLAA